MNVFYTRFFFFLSLIAFLTGCDKDDYPGNNEFVVAFENPSENFSGQESSKNIRLVFSQAAPENGMITLKVISENLIYQSDFTTEPEAVNGIIQIPVEKGSRESFLKVNKFAEVLPGDEKALQLKITSIELPSFHAFTQGNTETEISFSESAALGGTMNPEVGGPNQPNQVYVDLSTKSQTKIRRDIWDFGFYSGEGFHVKLNSSLYMFARPLEINDIDAVRESDVVTLKPWMNFLLAGSEEFIDHPSGDLNKLAIQPISETDEENPVYLVKMGNEIGTETPAPGSVAVAGKERGWKKVRILRRGNDYLFQYADVDSSTHQEVLISKDEAFNFTFFSITNNIVSVEPARENWTLNFTVTMEIEPLPEGSDTAYGFSDYVKINAPGNVKAYRVSTSDYTYSDFGENHIEENKFSSDERIIGSSWRKATPPDRELITNIFYVIKDAQGNYYKLRFTALENENGIRGYPAFEYKLLK